MVSVTRVLGLYKNYNTIPLVVLMNAAARGTEVHKWCAAYAKGLYYPISKENKPYCDKFKVWFDKYVESVIGVEIELIDSVYDYIGHIDLIAVLKGDEYPTIIDYKTPMQKDILWEAQLAAYYKLAKKYSPIRAGSLIFNPTLKFNQYPGDIINRGFKAFLNALYAYKYFIEERR